MRTAAATTHPAKALQRRHLPDLLAGPAILAKPIGVCIGGRQGGWRSAAVPSTTTVCAQNKPPESPGAAATKRLLPPQGAHGCHRLTLVGRHRALVPCVEHDSVARVAFTLTGRGRAKLRREGQAWQVDVSKQCSLQGAATHVLSSLAAATTVFPGRQQTQCRLTAGQQPAAACPSHHRLAHPGGRCAVVQVVDLGLAALAQLHVGKAVVMAGVGAWHAWQRGCTCCIA